MDLKTALIEIGGSHEECLLTQMMALRSAGHRLTLICTPEIKARNPHFERYVEAILVVGFTGKAWQDFRLMSGINRFLKEEGFAKAVINTAQGGHIRNLCLTAPRQVEFTGIIHTARKFQGSFTQKLISRKIKKYLVLSDFLLEKVTAPKGVRIESFYPLEYERFGLRLDKPSGETWITIPGGVESRRKDLQGFLEMLGSLPRTGLKFIFLGKSDRSKPETADFMQQIEAQGRTEQLVFFDDFIAPDRFDAYITHTDLLWPLIHPGTRSAEQYISNQISGSFNLAYGYRIPLLIHEAYRDIEDLRLASFFYDPADFAATLREAISGRNAQAAAIASVGKWQQAYRFGKFLSFI